MSADWALMVTTWTRTLLALSVIVSGSVMQPGVRDRKRARTETPRPSIFKLSLIALMVLLLNRVLADAGCEEYEKFLVPRVRGFRLEQISQQRDPVQERDVGLGLLLGVHEDSADDGGRSAFRYH